MQVFVRKSDLTLAVIPVGGSFPDVPIMDRNAYGALYTVMTLPPSFIVQDPTTSSVNLKSDWRTAAGNAHMICANEAQRRILESFSAFMQTNAASANTDAILLYGANSSTWPPDAKSRLAAANTGYDYIAAVRQASDALEAALPVDPTADTHWPVRIPVVYIPGY